MSPFIYIICYLSALKAQTTKATYHSVTYMNCTTRHSPPSSTGSGDETSIGCNNNEALTSCGFSTISATDYFNHPGSYVTNSLKMKSHLCHARNNENGYGVQAHARCCSFASSVTDVSCIGFRTTTFVDAIQTTSCVDTSYQYLTGCSALTSTESSKLSSLLGMVPNEMKLANAVPNTDYVITKQTCASHDNH
eukprot:326404_1